MKENVGPLDRMVRAVVGPGLILLGYARLGGRSGNVPGLLAIVGGALILESAITRVCPVNRLLGIDTRSERERMRGVEIPVGRVSWTPPAGQQARH